MRTERRPASGMIYPLARAVLSPGPATNAAIALLTFLVVAGAALYGVLPIGLPDPVPASAPPTAFSSARALAHVRAIAQRPHPIGSPANAAVRDYLVEEFSTLGLKPEVQKATAGNRLGPHSPGRQRRGGGGGGDARDETGFEGGPASTTRRDLPVHRWGRARDAGRTRLREWPPLGQRCRSGAEPRSPRQHGCRTHVRDQ